MTFYAEIVKRRLRDDHPLGPKYQHPDPTLFALQKTRQFRLTTASSQDIWCAFAGQPLPRGCVAARLSRWDGDATQTAFGVVHPVRSIIFPIGKKLIAGWNIRNDNEIFPDWDLLCAEGWPQFVGPAVYGNEHRHGFKAFAAAQQEAELLAEIDAIPTEEEEQRREDRAAKRPPTTDDDILADRVTFRDGVAVVLQASPQRDGGLQS